MARYPQIYFYKRQIVTSENLPKCHVLPRNPDDTAISGIGTKIATKYLEDTTAFLRRLMIKTYAISSVRAVSNRTFVG